MECVFETKNLYKKGKILYDGFQQFVDNMEDAKIRKSYEGLNSFQDFFSSFKMARLHFRSQNFLPE